MMLRVLTETSSFRGYVGGRDMALMGSRFLIKICNNPIRSFFNLKRRKDAKTQRDSTSIEGYLFKGYVGGRDPALMGSRFLIEICKNPLVTALFSVRSFFNLKRRKDAKTQRDSTSIEGYLFNERLSGRNNEAYSSSLYTSPLRLCAFASFKIKNLRKVKTAWNGGNPKLLNQRRTLTEAGTHPLSIDHKQDVPPKAISGGQFGK